MSDPLEAALDAPVEYGNKTWKVRDFLSAFSASEIDDIMRAAIAAYLRARAEVGGALSPTLEYDGLVADALRDLAAEVERG